MAEQVLEAVYENGVFRILEPLKIPLEEGQLVRIVRIEKLANEEGNQQTHPEATEVPEGRSVTESSMPGSSGD